MVLVFPKTKGEDVMATKADLKRALSQPSEVAALAILRQPSTFEMKPDSFIPRSAINAARLTGRSIVIFTYGTIERADPFPGYVESVIEQMLAALSHFQEELKLESPRSSGQFTLIFEILCTNHPDPLPGRKSQEVKLEESKKNLTIRTRILDP